MAGEASIGVSKYAKDKNELCHRGCGICGSYRRAGAGRRCPAFRRAVGFDVAAGRRSSERCTAEGALPQGALLAACKIARLLPELALALRKSLGLAYAWLPAVPAASWLLITDPLDPQAQNRSGRGHPKGASAIRGPPILYGDVHGPFLERVRYAPAVHSDCAHNLTPKVMRLAYLNNAPIVRNAQKLTLFTTHAPAAAAMPASRIGGSVRTNTVSSVAKAASAFSPASNSSLIAR